MKSPQPLNIHWLNVLDFFKIKTVNLTSCRIKDEPQEKQSLLPAPRALSTQSSIVSPQQSSSVTSSRGWDSLKPGSHASSHKKDVVAWVGQRRKCFLALLWYSSAVSQRVVSHHINLYQPVLQGSSCLILFGVMFSLTLAHQKSFKDSLANESTCAVDIKMYIWMLIVRVLGCCTCLRP